ncbi:MAG: sigma-70 family RNA polymerase sigma factor [Sediminibacterium sp.]
MTPEQQFNLIYEQHFAKVSRLCKGYFNGDEAQAGDVAQDVFIKVWQHFGSFRNESSISTWIYRIAANTCLTHLRKASTKKEIKTANFADTAAAEYNNETELKLKLMYGCIQKLDETGKLIILMVLEGVEYQEIAEVAGVTEETLRVRIHRIKNSLSNCVQI